MARTLRLADNFTNTLRDVGAEPGQGVVAADAESVGDLVDDGTERTNVSWHARWETGEAPDRRTTVLRIEALDGEFVPVIDCVEHPEATRGCTEQVLDDGTRVIAGETSYREPGNAGLPIWRMWSPQAVAIHPDGRQVWLQVQLEVRDGDPVPPGDRLDDYSGPLTLEQMRQIVQRPEWAELPLP